MKHLSFFLFLLASTIGSAQVAIYNQPNTDIYWSVFTPQPGNFRPEYGDELTFAAGPRSVTNVAISLAITQTGTFTFSLNTHFRDMTSGSPGTEYWGGTQQVTMVVASGGAAQTVNVAVPNIVVPDHTYIGFDIAFGTPTPSTVSLAFGGAATTGSSDPTFFWNNELGSFAHGTWGSSSGSNIKMTVTAVPEPATLATLAGGILLLRRRGRSTKK